MYDLAEVYPQLKRMGFRDFQQLRDFSQTLQEAMVTTDYNLQEVATICSQCLGPNIDSCELPALAELNESSLAGFLANLDVPKLKKFAMAFMEDGHGLCNVSRSYERIDQGMASFHLALRQYRRRHPWLQDNLTGHDRFNRISDDQRTVFYGVRSNPLEPGDSPILMVAHMGGEPLTIELENWLGLDMDDWRVAIATPDLNLDTDLENPCHFTLKDSQGVLFEQKK